MLNLASFEPAFSLELKRILLAFSRRGGMRSALIRGAAAVVFGGPRGAEEAGRPPLEPLPIQKCQKSAL